jgi:hypothetical protein
MSITTEAPHGQTTEAIALLAGWTGEEPQTLVSRKLVIDRLLDLRNAVDAASRAHIDAILADVPGVTVVEGTWWITQLTTLESRLTEQEAGTRA